MLVRKPPRTRGSGSRPPTTEASAVTPDAVLTFMRLIWAVDHELQRVSKRMEAALGLTVPQRMTLLLIGRKHGVLASELAHLLHLHPGTVSGIIHRLEDSGLIVREGDAADGRRLRLTLSEAGQAANRRRTGTFEAAVRRVLASASTVDLGGAAVVLKQLAKELRMSGDAHRATRPTRRPSRAQ